MLTKKERVTVALIGLGALVLLFVIVFLPFATFETYGHESWQFVTSALVAIFCTSAIAAGS